MLAHQRRQDGVEPGAKPFLLQCRLLAVGDDGRSEVVASWGVPDKGYGVPEHLQALETYGPCPVHRLTYKPVLPRLGGIPEARG